jgi:hypothetical protein
VLSLNKVLFVQRRVTRPCATVISGNTTAGILNKHAEIYINTKSHQGTIYNKIVSNRVGDFMQARQYKMKHFNCYDLFTSFLLEREADRTIVAVEGDTLVDILMGFVARLPLAADVEDWEKGIWA